jgi:hypothetical protein
MRWRVTYHWRQVPYPGRALCGRATLSRTWGDKNGVGDASGDERGTRGGGRSSAITTTTTTILIKVRHVEINIGGRGHGTEGSVFLAFFGVGAGAGDGDFLGAGEREAAIRQGAGGDEDVGGSGAEDDGRDGLLVAGDGVLDVAGAGTEDLDFVAAGARNAGAVAGECDGAYAVGLGWGEEG